MGADYIGAAGLTEIFGSEVNVMDMWTSGGKTHVIVLVELYVCVVSLLHWKRKYGSRMIIMFVDI